MSNFLYDAEIQRDFADTRRANERKLRLQQEEEERLRAELAKNAARRAAEQRSLLAARLESDLHTAFFTANPGATEQDWQRLGPQIRDDHMRAAASKGATNVFDKIRDEAFAREQETLARRSRFEQLPERT